MGDLRIERINSTQTLTALKPVWDELLATCPHATPFLTHEWVKNWWKHFGDRNELCVLLLREDSRPVLIAPLMRYIGRLHERYVPLPAVVIGTIANYHSNRSDFICAEFQPEYLRAIWDYLLREERWHMLRLFPLFETTPTAFALRELLESERVPALFTHSQTSPYLALPDKSEFAKSVPKQIARQVRKAQREPIGLGVEYITDASRIAEIFPDILAISEKGWAAREGTAISSNAQLRGFYGDLAESAAQKGWLFLAILRLDGRPIAFEYNLAYGTTLYNLKLAFDSAFSQHAPGSLLKHSMLAHVLEYMPHLREYDMLGDADSYKLMWTARTRRHVKAYVYHPRSFYARTLHALHSAALCHSQQRSKLIWKPGYEAAQEVFKKA